MIMKHLGPLAFCPSHMAGNLEGPYLRNLPVQRKHILSADHATGDEAAQSRCGGTAQGRKGGGLGRKCE